MKLKIVILSIFLSLLFFSCTDSAYIGMRAIKYEVTGSADTVNLTISNEDDGTSQYSDKTLPWTYEFQAPKGQFIYVSAQNQNSTGSVTATIYVNGEEYKSSTSEGAYVIATASGSVY